MLVTFGFTTWQSISGYVIQAGLEPLNGFNNRVRVYILLSGDAANIIPRPRGLQLNSQNNLNFVDNNINYSFPNIQYRGNIFEYNNRFFYDILEFSYDIQGAGTQHSPITCTNNATETFDPKICTSRGKIATNQFGNNAAPLLGFRALQYGGGQTAIQMISERCRLGGWLEQMIDQNNNKCCQGIQVDLQFTLNNNVYNCSPGSEGLSYMFYEELNGLALALPIRRIWNRNLNDLFTDKLLFEEVSSATGTDFIDQYGKPDHTMPGGRNKTLEICTVISATNNVQNFDCRT